MTDYKCEEVLPYDDKTNKTEQVEQMFDNIASEYDPMNHLMSLFNDTSWRRKALNALSAFHPKHILDIATGTGDFAISAYEELEAEKIVGIDLSEKMLEVGRKKVEAKNLSSVISLEKGDSLNLRFEDNTFDAITVAFGVRNFSDLQKGLTEMYRVLKPGGAVAVLELAQPSNPIFLLGYKIYTKFIIPVFAKLHNTDKRAYEYLPESIAACPQRKAMTDLMQKCGFKEATYTTYTMGTCAFYLAKK